jgi:hypothetical protein
MQCRTQQNRINRPPIFKVTFPLNSFVRLLVGTDYEGGDPLQKMLALDKDMWLRITDYDMEKNRKVMEQNLLANLARGRDAYLKWRHDSDSDSNEGL